jgi:lipoprotein-anchoring transpeptidase ErfK/SrfK
VLTGFQRPLLVIAAAALAGCGAATAGHERAEPLAQTLRAKAKCHAGDVRNLRTPRAAYGAIVPRKAVAYSRPGGRALARFGPKNVNGAPTVLGVLSVRVKAGCVPAWFRVQLPMRPNGAIGYVRARDVQVVRVKTRIEVDLSQRRVTLFRSGKRVLTARAAIGSSATPTPIGRYYVNQRLVPTNPGGPYGPGAIGISAFSNVLTGWTQGGPIAIHGTNEPWSIGHSVSNGCIRLQNSVLRRIFAQAWAGTPVVIHR